MALNAISQWHKLPLEMLEDHYELQDSEDGSGRVPTPGEFKLDACLMTVQCIRPQSDNDYSEFVKRHYITYGGFHQGKVIIKPPWVVVTFDDGWFDLCTLCKKWCVDGHLQSRGHRAKVKEWFENYDARRLRYRLLPCYKWLFVPPPPPWPPPAETSNLVSAADQGVDQQPPAETSNLVSAADQGGDQQPPAESSNLVSAADQGGNQQPPAETSDLVWL